jgi:hypothetical protein
MKDLGCQNLGVRKHFTEQISINLCCLSNRDPQERRMSEEYPILGFSANIRILNFLSCLHLTDEDVG